MCKRKVMETPKQHQSREVMEKVAKNCLMQILHYVKKKKKILKKELKSEKKSKKAY